MKTSKPNSALEPAAEPNIGSIFNTGKGGKATTKRTRSNVEDELEDAEDQPQAKKSKETERKEKKKSRTKIFSLVLRLLCFIAFTFSYSILIRIYWWSNSVWLRLYVKSQAFLLEKIVSLLPKWVELQQEKIKFNRIYWHGLGNVCSGNSWWKMSVFRMIFSVQF